MLKMVRERVPRELHAPFLGVFKVSLDGAPSSLFLSKGNWNEMILKVPSNRKPISIGKSILGKQEIAAFPWSLC